MRLHELLESNYLDDINSYLDAENPDDMFSRGERVPDYDTTDAVAPAENNETMFYTDGRDLQDRDGNLPRYGYRVMHHKEYDQAKLAGFFAPSKFYKRMHVSAQPKMGYRDGGDEHYVIKFKLHPGDGWHGKTSGEGEVYGVTYDNVPFERATLIDRV